ncbi:MAG: hypothetical protein JNG84_04290 [Archangium sp.]|nr:hypothetical protein [Archangium sp.]
MNADLLPLMAPRLSGTELFKTVAVLGSGPQAGELASLRGDDTIVAVMNNAWRAVPDWDYWLYADDFPEEGKPAPELRARRGRSSPQYWPAIEAHGGLVLCGATMAYATGYWALHTMPFSQVSFFATDMTYSGAKTHFYGQGAPDPLRRDVTLQDHEAKGLRLQYFALRASCLFLNASNAEETRLVVPRIRSGVSLRRNVAAEVMPTLRELLRAMDDAATPALQLERATPASWRVPNYGLIMNEPGLWSHTAAVDARWRALKPMSDALAQQVEAAFARE